MSEFYDLISLIKLYSCEHGAWNENMLKMMVTVLGLRSGALRDCG